MRKCNVTLFSSVTHWMEVLGCWDFGLAISMLGGELRWPNL